MKLWLALGAGTLAAAMLAGCGGDSDNDPVPSTDTPADRRVRSHGATNGATD